MNAAIITNMLHKRSTMVAIGFVVMACAMLAYFNTGLSVPFVTNGLVLKFNGVWQVPRLPGFLLAVGLNILIISALVHLNKVYNLLRSLTMLQGTFFIIMQFTTPTLLVCLTPGLVMCAVAMLCMWLMLSQYGYEFCDTRRIFLIALVLSLGTAFDVRYLVLMPVLVIGCIQMRIFSIRTLLAILMGVITPWIIMIGFGLVSPFDIGWPRTQLVLSEFGTASTMTVATAVFTAFVILGALLQNMIKILTYNAQSRAMLGLVTTLTLVTLAATAVNSADIYFYLPLLNCCCALQLAHLFGVIHTHRRSYIAIVSIAAIYMIVLLWKVIVKLM